MHWTRSLLVQPGQVRSGRRVLVPNVHVVLWAGGLRVQTYSRSVGGHMGVFMGSYTSIVRVQNHESQLLMSVTNHDNEDEDEPDE